VNIFTISSYKILLHAKNNRHCIHGKSIDKFCRVTQEFFQSDDGRAVEIISRRSEFIKYYHGDKFINMMGSGSICLNVERTALVNNPTVTDRIPHRVYKGDFKIWY
jgi:hypothetical protein